MSKERGIERTDQGRRISGEEDARHGDAAVVEAHAPAPRRGELERSTRETRIKAELHLDGGAIAIGHPLGASGGRIIGHAAHELARRGSGVAVVALCIGVGQGLAVILERVQ